MSLNNNFTLDVDIKEVNYAYARKITANDSVTFVVNLFKDGLPLDLTNVSTVSLANTRLDKVTVVTPGSKTGANQVTFELGQNETKTPGRVTAVIQLYDADGRLSTLAFNYTVIEDPTGDGYIPPGSDQTLIQVVLGDGPLVIQQGKDAASYAKTETDKATTYAYSETDKAVLHSNTVTDSNTTYIKDKADTAAANMNTAANSTKLNYLAPVATHAAIGTTYPSPSEGDLVQVTSDTDPAKNGNYRRTGGVWKLVQKGDLTGKADKADISAVDAARADVVRQMVHSGVLDFGYDNGGVWTNGIYIPGTNPTNSMYISSDSANTDKISRVVVNGYKSDISHSTLVTLPAPSTFGTREDLVFLEAWFPTTTPNVLSWRIRTVAGVDFEKYPEGLGVSGVTDGWGIGDNPNILPQGNNSIPVSYIIANGSSQWTTGRQRETTGATTLKIALGDYGLYVAGDGSQTSKDTLKTHDGYVYAIPLFRVKRRNSGGYRVDNLNGGRDFFKPSFTTTTVTESGKINSMTFDSSAYSLVKVGDNFVYSDISQYSANRFEILSKDGNNTLTFINRGTSSIGVTTNNTAWVLVSDRPDNLYSNIIDKDDIVDLRHKVSLTGYNYQQLLEENFDKLLRGQLLTKDTPTIHKQRFGLEKAPHYVKPELAPVRVKGNDGVERELVNEIGSSDKLTIVTASEVSIDNAKIMDGRPSYKIQGNSSGTYILSSNFTFRGGKYYLIIMNVEGANGTDDFIVNVNGSGVWIQASGTRCVKVAPTSDVSDLVFSEHTNNPVWVGAIRLIEVDKATYDLVNVDVNFTGEELAKKFPYVSSYPNVIGNTFDEENYDLEKRGTFTFTKTGTGIATKYKLEYGSTYQHDWGASTTYVNNPRFTHVKLGDKVYMSIKPISGTTVFFIMERNSAGTNLTNTRVIGTFANYTVRHSDCAYIELAVTGDGVNSTTEFSHLTVYVGAHYHKELYIPYGTHLLPNDYAENLVSTDFSKITDRRNILSDAQTSQTITDIIDPTDNKHLPHVTTTQATAGQWSVGDTVKIKANYPVTGVIDSDTALARVVGLSSTDSYQAYLDTVSGIVNGDVVQVLDSDLNPIVVRYIKIINSTDKLIEWYSDSGLTSKQSFGSSNVGNSLIETTASTSSPVVSHTSTKTITGTWTNLGTKEVTYTINGITDGVTTGLTDTTDFKVQYSVNYPAGEGLENLPSEVLGGTINGQELEKSGTVVKVKANFEGKVESNSDLIPHDTKFQVNGSLTSPSSTWYSIITSEIAKMGKLDSTLYARSATTNGQIMQQLFSFNLIRLVEDKFGEGFFNDCLTTADKVAKLKNVIKQARTHWHGYGSSPSGNKAYLAWWDNSTSSWGSSLTHTNSSVAKLTNSADLTANPKFLDSNGFLHTITYAEASDGVTASTIYTDYVELELELNVAETGYDVLLPKEKFPVLSENLLTQNQAFPVDLSGFTAGTGTTLEISNKGVLQVNAPSTTYGVFVNNFMGRNSRYITVSFEVSTTKTIAFYPTAIGTNYKVNLNPTTEFVKIEKTFDLLSDTKTNIEIYNTSGVAHSFKLRNLKFEYGINEHPTWSPGRRKKTVHNFLGKVAGSTWENKHKSHRVLSASFSNPTTINNEAIGIYDNIKKQDGVLTKLSSITSTYYAQQLFEFDLSHLGLSLKELKAALRKLTVSWTGYGSGATETIANPTTAPTLAASGTTSTLPAGTYYVKYSWLNANGETLGSSGNYSITTASGQQIDVTLPTFPTGATSANIYIGTTAGSETKQGNTTTTSYIQSSGLVAGSALPTSNTTGKLTYGANVKYWDNTSGTWTTRQTSTSSTPATVGDHTFSTNFVSNSQKMYVLLHSTHPSDGTIASEIYTDYIKLEVELADYVDYVPANVVKVRKETKEVKLVYPTKSNRIGLEDSVELWYKAVPYQYITVDNLTIKSIGHSAFLTKAGSGKNYEIPTNYKNSVLFTRNKTKYSTTTKFSEYIKYGVESYVRSARVSDIVESFGYLSTIISPNLKVGLLISKNTSYPTDTENVYLAKVNGKDGIVHLDVDTSSADFTDSFGYVPMILEKDGLLYLGIFGDVFTINTATIINGAIGIVELQGRPLVKGVK